MKNIALASLATVALAGAAALGTSYYTGQKAAQAFHQLTQNRGDDALHLEVIHYQRGWLRSEARTHWSWEADEEQYRIEAVHHILHGPWANGQAARITTQFLLPQGSGPELAQALAQQPPLTWTTHVGWQGQSSHAVQGPAFTAEYADGSRLIWGGVEGHATLDAQRQSLHSEWSVPELRMLADDGGRIELVNLQFSTRATRAPSHRFWHGPADLRLQHVHMLTPQGFVLLNLQNVTATSATVLQDELLQLQLHTTAEAVKTPFYQTPSFELKAAVRRIDATWLDTWLSHNTRVQSEEDTLSTEHLAALLAHAPELEISQLRIGTEDGPAQFTGEVKYVGDPHMPLHLSQDLQARVKALLPKPTVQLMLARKVHEDYVDLLEQLGQDLQEDAMRNAIRDGVNKRTQALLEQGALQELGDDYTAELTFNADGLALNGTPTDVSNLLRLGGAL